MREPETTGPTPDRAHQPAQGHRGGHHDSLPGEGVPAGPGRAGVPGGQAGAGAGAGSGTDTEADTEIVDTASAARPAGPAGGPVESGTSANDLGTDSPEESRKDSCADQEEDQENHQEGRKDRENSQDPASLRQVRASGRRGTRSGPTTRGGRRAALRRGGRRAAPRRGGRRARRVEVRSWSRVLRRATGLVVALVLACAAGAVTWWGQVNPQAVSSAVLPVAATQAGAQTTYVCPAGPANTLKGVDVASTTSSTAMTPVGQTGGITYAGKDLDLSAGAGTSLDSADGGVLTVDPPQEGGAASAVGVVTTMAAGGDLRGLTAAACTQPAATAWIVGGSAAPGASAELRLANPGPTTVSAKVTAYGSSGPLSLPSNGEVTVPGESGRSILLETASSADPRLAVSVEAEGGSLAPVLVTEALDGETAAGTDIMAAGAAPSTDLVVPGVQLVSPEDQGEQAQESTGAVSSDAPVVRMVNPGSTPASVTVTMLGKDGPEPLPGAADVTVDPGAVFDISLAGVAEGTYGVQVTSDVPVSAAVRMVRSGGELPARSGALVHDQAWVQAGTQDALASGMLAVPRGSDLSSEVCLANSGKQDAGVVVSSADGSWSQEVSVPAGGALSVDVPGKVAALALSTPSGSADGLAASTVVTAQASGKAAGTLISVVPAVADAAAAAQRNVIIE